MPRTKVGPEASRPKGRTLEGNSLRISNLNILGNATWDSVIIRFVTGDSIEIRAGGRSIGVKHYKELGFDDKRTGSPDLLWGILKYLAKVHGELSSDDLNGKEGVHVKKNIPRLRARLKSGFGIADDPFHPYYASQSFRTRFIISGACPANS
jgi:hypothetical protein